jgi:hypothetical protein
VLARKRSAEFDWVCVRCGCPCDPPGERVVHLGGGHGMRACGPHAQPVLRSVFEEEMGAVAESALNGLPWRKRKLE